MDSAILESQVKQLLTRIERLSVEQRSLPQYHRRQKFCVLRQQLRCGFLTAKLQSRKIADRMLVGRWFFVLCVPISLSAICFVISDVVFGSRGFSVVISILAWCSLVAAVIALLKTGVDIQIEPYLQQAKQLLIQLQLQEEEIGHRRGSVVEEIRRYESELARTAQQLNAIQEQNSEERILRNLYRQNWKAMRDVEFEQFLEAVFLAQGYLVETTAVTGDQGVDLIVAKDDVRIAIQVKGYHSSVSNLDIKNPHDSSEAHADPDELLADYQILMTELQQTRDRLKDELFQALEGSTR